MGFWSSETLRRRAAAESIVTPFSDGRVKHAGYELALGGEAFATLSNDGKKQTLAPNGQVHIHAGQFALLLTEEVVKIPADAIGLISIKAGIKFKGLVNVSGFHVDPGYSGKLLFSVYNAGSKEIILDRNQPLFLLWLCNLDAETKETYDKPGKSTITGEDMMNLSGEVASPAMLKKEIEDLRNQLKELLDTLNRYKDYFSKVMIALVIAAVIGGFKYLAGIIAPASRNDGLPVVPAISTSTNTSSTPREAVKSPDHAQQKSSKGKTQNSQQTR